MLATSLPVAQWLEHPTGVRKVMGSIPIGDSDFFFVPSSRPAEYYFFSELKIHHLSLFINVYIVVVTTLSARLIFIDSRQDLHENLITCFTV